jgi:predicted porin
MEIFAMKKSLVALAVLSAFGASAFAQSSVTLNGRVDLSLKNSSNGTVSAQSLSTNGHGSSQFTLRGVEDLGGGMSARFHLEAALFADRGTIDTTRFFGRRATAALAGGFGEIRLGRDYTPTFWNLTIFDPFGTNGVGAYSNIHALQGGASTLVRADNTVGYFLPGNLGGIYGQAMVAAGEGTAGNKYVGARLGYQAGPINVAASYGQTYVAIAPAFQNDETLAFVNMAGSFNAGFATVMAQYGRQTLGNSTRTNALLGANVPAGPGFFRASFSRFTDNSAAADGARQVAAGYVYNLSRRTVVYGTVSRVTNDTARAFGAGLEGVAAIAGRNNTGAELGVSHAF